MKTEVVMPQMGESVAEGTVTKWLKQIGDHVQRDEPLFELTTDKVDADVPSPVEGVLVEIMVQPGETVEINALVAVIDTDGGQTAAKTESEAPPATGTSTAKTSANGATSTHVATTKAPTGASASGGSVDALRRTRSTPLVRRIAAEHGIADLAAISGTGRSGRVTKRDILSFIESGAARGVQARTNLPTHHPAVHVNPNDRVELMSPQRQRIAQHMIASRATSAHAQTVHEVDFTNVVAARAAQKAEFDERGARLTYTAFLVKALADVLPQFPVMNSAVDGDQIVYRGDLNIGVAVDTGSSLIVPVVRNADELSLLGIARAVGDLSERARTKKLSPDEVQNGTFTLSNPGIFGSEFGIPIINQPQTAILVTGGIKKRVVVDQQTDAIMVRPTSIWCLSFDHRVIDGATADRFMRALRDRIETWTGE